MRDFFDHLGMLYATDTQSFQAIFHLRWKPFVVHLMFVSPSFLNVWKNKLQHVVLLAATTRTYSFIFRSLSVATRVVRKCDMVLILIFKVHGGLWFSIAAHEVLNNTWHGVNDRLHLVSFVCSDRRRSSTPFFSWNCVFLLETTHYSVNRWVREAVILLILRSKHVAHSFKRLVIRKISFDDEATLFIRKNHFRHTTHVRSQKIAKKY